MFNKLFNILLRIISWNKHFFRQVIYTVVHQPTPEKAPEKEKMKDYSKSEKMQDRY